MNTTPRFREPPPITRQSQRVTLSTADVEALTPPLVLEVCLNGTVLGEVEIPRAIRFGDHFHMELCRPGGDFVEIAQMKIEGDSENE